MEIIEETFQFKYILQSVNLNEKYLYEYESSSLIIKNFIYINNINDVQ